MGKVTGFKEYNRETPTRRPVAERVNDYFEVYQPFPDDSVRTQAARCMDCGIPFCHTGCPVNNIIPDWNDFVYHDEWKDAIRILHSITLMVTGGSLMPSTQAASQGAGQMRPVNSGKLFVECRMRIASFHSS